MNRIEVVRESRELAKKIDDVLTYTKDYIDSIENPTNTFEGFKDRLNNFVHGKLIQILFLEDATPEERKTLQSLKSLAKVIVDKQLQYDEIAKNL
jgi:hypothetical protein